MKKQQLLSLVLGMALLTVGTFAQAQQNNRSQQSKGPKKKVSADLIQLATGEKPSVVALSGDEMLAQENLSMVVDGKVVIDAVATDSDGAALLQALTDLGLEQGSYYERMVSGLFPVDRLSQLESVGALSFVQPAYAPIKSVGLVTSQADVAMRADVAKATYNVTGAGSKIGVLSDSYNARFGAAAGVASGDLPTDVQVLADIPVGSDEGRAMVELIHDLAPGAKQAFHTAFTGQANFANGIRALAAEGCNIIVDDVFYFAEPFFQDGIIAQAVDEVVKNKVTYFSAAGNSTNTSYESNFRKSGVVVPGYGEAHDFGNGDIRQTFTLSPRGTFRVGLQWDDPFFSVSGGEGARTDMDLLVYFNGSLAFRSINNNIGGDPFEYIGLTSNSPNPISVEIVITKFAGPDPSMIKWVHFGNGNVPTFIEYNTFSSTCVGHANAQGAIAVGASAFFNTPAFNPNLSAPVINGFSALGGTPVFIKKDGKVTGFSDDKRRKKPEITAADGTNTTFFGGDTPFDADAFPNFFGTSAAAPHAAAVAALMQEVRNVTMTPAAVLDMMVQSAIDMDNPATPGFDVGFDFKTGAGFIQADVCVALAGGNANERLGELVAETTVGEFQVFPNPSNGMLNVDFGGLSANEVFVLNAAGQVVSQSKVAGNQRLTLNLNGQPNGLYLVRVVSPESVKTAKVLLNR